MAGALPLPIDPMRQATPIEGAFEEVEDLEPMGERSEEDAEGGITYFDDEIAKPQTEFYDNLADGYFEEGYLDQVAAELIIKVDQDIEARKPRVELYAEGLRRTGLGRDAPGGANFMGASRVVHPGLLKAGVDFAACTIKELFPANGPVKMHIEGEPNPRVVDRARRKATYMNWQLREQIPEYKPELEQICTQVPLAGVQYMLWWHDDSLGRPNVEFFPIDKVILPFFATSLYTTSRFALLVELDEIKFNDRVRTGMYRDVDGMETPPSQVPEPTEAQTANDKIEGKVQTAFNEDGVRQMYRLNITMECEPDTLSPEGRAVPYDITIDITTGKVLSWYRNWEENDKFFQRMDWLVEFPMIPWRGAQAIGLVHAIGGMSAAQTGAVRALLDTAHINNSPALLKLKGAKIGGQNQLVDPTGVTEIDGGIGVTDIRQIAMPMPFNQPSAVLFQLLSYLDSWSEGMVRTALDNISTDTNTNVPVGTQMSRVEQGLKVYSSIFSRLHDAQARCFKILHRLNRQYMPEAVHLGEDEVIHRSDFEGPMDIVPVSDPNLASEMQRYAQMQEVDRIDAMNPGVIDKREKVKRQLEMLKVPDYKGIMIKIPEPEFSDPVTENMKMTMGAPVAAFPQQDHLAHMQVLLSFMTNPMLGQNPLIAPTFMPAALEHLKQHLIFWYVDKHMQILEGVLDGQPISELMDPDPETRKAFDQMMAAASTKIDGLVAMELEKLPPIIQQAMAMVSSMQPQVQDPILQANLAETARKTKQDQMRDQNDKDKLKLEGQKAEHSATVAQARVLTDAEWIDLENRRAEAEIAKASEPPPVDPNKILQGENERAIADQNNATKLAINDADNETARELAVLEIATAEKVAVSNGNGIGKNPRP